MSRPNGAGMGAGAREADVQQLLRQVLRDPIPEEPASLWLLLRALVRRFPLWTFQPHAYARLHGNLPTTHPLSSIIESVLRDEGINDERQELLDSVHAELDRRRYGLLTNQSHYWFTRIEDETGRLLRLPPFPTMFLPRAVDLATWEADEDGTGGYVSPYEEIGRELVACVEARNRATPGTAERDRAQAALDEFLRRLGVQLGRGRPPAGAPEEVLAALVAEGRTLFEQLWDVFPFEISDATARMLESYEAEERRLWAARLALPFLSRPEILALNQLSEEARRWRRGHGNRPTPRTVTIWTLAHRLGLEATTIVRVVLNTPDLEYFEGDNPINAFLPQPR